MEGGLSPHRPHSGAVHLGPNPAVTPELYALGKLPNFSVPQFPHL